jgi:hypothetical protein
MLYGAGIFDTLSRIEEINKVTSELHVQQCLYQNNTNQTEMHLTNLYASNLYQIVLNFVL